VIVSIAVIWGARSYLRGLEQAAFVRLAYIEAQLRGTGNAQEVPATLIDELQDLTRQWSIGEAQGYAWLSLGHLHYRLGDYIMAATTYRQAQAATQPTRLLWSLATLGAAYALEGSGEWQRAQEAYQRLIDTQQAGFLLEAYYGKGRALERGNDLDGAIAAYAVVVERYPASAQTLGIADKIETLQARRD
jgi:tetratricopeptide (TPR) repeat protein